MQVHSYLELATTAIGWYIANGISEILVQSGLVFVPILVALLRNWIEPMRSQEAKVAAVVSLRRMEHDAAIALIVIVFCFLPAVPIDPTEIEYEDVHLDKVVTAGDPDVPYMRHRHSVDEIRIPLAWWFIYEVSSVSTNAVLEVIKQLGEPATLRPLLRRIGKINIEDEILLSEMRRFRRDCYDPSLAKYQNSENPPPAKNLLEDVDWLGSRIFANTPGYYKRCLNVDACGTGYYSTTPMSQWRNAGDADFYQPSQPYCNIWWNHSDLGLRQKILNELIRVAPWFKEDVDRLKKRQQNSKTLGPEASDHEDRFLRRFVSQAPRIKTQRADDNQTFRFFSTDIFSVDGVQQILGSIGALIASTILHIAMELIVIGLPMLQALMLMMLYVSIPLLVPYAVVHPIILIRLVLILFALRFVSAIWGIAEFLDEKLIDAMYPDSSFLEFGLSGSAADVVFGLVTLFSYLTLPLAWFYLVGIIGSSAIGALSHGWGRMSQNLDSVSSTSANRATRMILGGRK